MTGSLAQRHLVPEILDGLDAHDSRAIRSRRDLAWINALMFQPRIMAALLRRHTREPPRRLLEIGSGDATFMLAVAGHLASEWRNVELVALDRIDLVSAETRWNFEKLGWRVETVVADVFDWIETPGLTPFDAVCTNLFLHHFEGEALAHLCASLQRIAPVFAATEPRRNAIALSACALLRLIGANDVTMHDAAASVRAGFSGDDLTKLWPARHSGRVEERAIGPFTHAFAVNSDAV